MKSYSVKSVSPIYDIVRTPPLPPGLSFRNFKKVFLDFSNKKGGVGKIGEVVLKKGVPYFYTN